VAQLSTLGGNMSTTQTTKRRMAICALLSVAAMLFGYLWGSHGHHGRDEIFWSGLCMVAGLILGFASVVRQEKPALLSWFALLLSLSPYLLLFLALLISFKSR
jgi:drug/metabolite transporter (DMT)-like permease